MGESASQEGGGVAQLATALAPVLEQFRDGLTNLGNSVLKKLKNQVGRGAQRGAKRGQKSGPKKTAAKSRGKAKGGANIQIGKGKVQKKPKKVSQKGKGAPPKKTSKKVAAKKNKKKANF